MKRYVEDLKSNPEAWKNWEWRSSDYVNSKWRKLYTHPSWDMDCEYRRRKIAKKTRSKSKTYAIVLAEFIKDLETERYPKSNWQVSFNEGRSREDLRVYPFYSENAVYRRKIPIETHNITLPGGEVILNAVNLLEVPDNQSIYCVQIRHQMGGFSVYLHDINNTRDEKVYCTAFPDSSKMVHFYFWNEMDAKAAVEKLQEINTPNKLEKLFSSALQAHETVKGLFSNVLDKAKFN